MANIDILRTLGDDAIGNHFQVVVPSLFLGEETLNFNMRILSATIPERKISTYDITKSGRTMAKVKGEIDQEKEISISFRADKYWKCYKKIAKWMQFIQNNRTGAIASDSGVDGMGGASTFRTNVEFWSLTSLDNGVPNAIWTLEDAFPTSLSNISFSEETTDPIEVDCSFTGVNIIYPED